MSGAGQSTCWTMIRAAADGDAAARQEFAQRYEPVVRAYLVARWNGSPLKQQVGDALQDVFIEFLRDGGAMDRAQPDRTGGFRAFLFGVTRNVARRHEQNRSRERNEQPATAFLDQQHRDDDQLTRIFDRVWAERIMREAAKQHRAQAEQTGADAVRRFELLSLRFGEGLPIRDIAERWQVPAAELHREYAKARTEFEAALTGVMRYYEPRATEPELASHMREVMGSLVP